MSFISEQIPSLINGVSQQPPSLRLVTQSEAEENTIVSIAEGLKKRPPLEHVTKLNNKTDIDAAVHFINRNTTQRYVAIVTSLQFDPAFSEDFTQASLEVFDLEGNSQSVNGVEGNALTYLTTAFAKSNLKIITIADFSFILNKSIVTRKETTLGSDRGPEGIWFLKQASSTPTMRTYINGGSGGIIAASNDATAQIDDIYTKMLTNFGTNWDFFKTQGSNVWTRAKNFGPFTMHAEAPEANLIAIKGTVANFADLPARTANGFTVKVTGDPNSNTDDYWVKHSNPGDTSAGEWVETVGPRLPNKIEAATMPIKLVKTSEGAWDDAFSSDFGETVFSLSTIDWADRVVGDEDTVPDPSFINNTISDLFFYKNRFGFLSGENLIMSELGEFFNFYITSATDLVDTDTIDLAAPSLKVSLLKNSIAFNDKLLVFSEDSQFELGEFAAGGLTPTNSKLSLVTEYHHDSLVSPVLSGRKIYFAHEKDGYSEVREFGVIEDLQEEVAEDVTSHVPSYIQGSVRKVVADGDLLYVLPNDNKNEVYLYKFLFQGGTKKLSSWRKWVFSEEEKVIDLHVIDSIVYMVIVRPDGTYLDKLSIQDANLTGLTASSTQLPFKVLLDRLTEVTGTYHSGNDLTTWTLPYPDDFGSTFRVIYGPAWDGLEGSMISGTTQATESTITIAGDYSDHSCFIGKEYRMRYEFTEPTIKTEVQGRQSSLTGGTLKIRKFSVDYFKAAHFKMQVTANGRDPFTYTFNSITPGQTSIGDTDFEAGSFKKLVLSDSKKLKIELISDSYLPCGFTGADWEGNHVVRTTPRSR